MEEEDAHCCHDDVKIMLDGEGLQNRGQCNATGTLFFITLFPLVLG